MKQDTKNFQIPPEFLPEPSPTITPEMIQSMFKTLEAEGMVYYSEGGVYVPTESGWKLLMSVNPTKEFVTVYGSPAITATNKTAFGFIKSKEIRTDKDSIVGVKADKCCKDLNPEFKRSLAGRKKVQITVEADGVTDVISAYGSPALRLDSENAIFVRKDDKIDGRTAAILADRAASDLKKELIEKLKNPKTRALITLEIKS